MCGIWSLLGSYDPSIILDYFEKISNRGPDDKRVWYYGDLILGFHRLAIMDLSPDGNQPFRHPRKNIDLICNGEIFNHETIYSDLNLKSFSKSDCEVILYLYEIYGIGLTLKSLDGEFAFVIYDQTENKVIAARDPFGIRPLFMGINESTCNIIFSSEIKGIPPNYNIEPVKPGHYYEIHMTKVREGNLTNLVVMKPYYTYTYYIFPESPNRQIEKKS